ASLGDVSSVNFYLFKSFRRVLIGRAVKERKTKLRNMFWYTSEDEIDTPYEEVLIGDERQQEITHRLREGISSLTKRQREAVFLHFFNNLTYEEVALVMDMRIDSAYNIISKSIEKLRKKLSGNLFSFLL